jgi:hypothetical protein
MSGGSAARYGPTAAAGTRVGTDTFYNNVKIACRDATTVFLPFIPNGIPNADLNYILKIEPSPGKTSNAILITITPRLRAPLDNENITTSVTVAKSKKGISEGHIYSLQVGNWITGVKPAFLKGKRIGYFLMLIYLYIARRLDMYKIELEDMAQIPGYYEFMGFIAYDPKFNEEEKTRYYRDNTGWRQGVDKVFEELYSKNNADGNEWNWRNDVNAKESIKNIKGVTPYTLPSSHGMRGGRKRHRFKKSKSKIRRTKTRKTKRRKTKKRRNSRSRKCK